MKPEVAYYIVYFHFSLMTSAERLALRHLQTTMKATMGRSDLGAQQEARNSRLHAKWLSDDPEATLLASEGYEAFMQRTATRLMEECRPQLQLNYCPKCGELARTPSARQCRFCKHDWH